MNTSKITQWEYAKLLLPFDDAMTEEALIDMSRGALFCWIDETKKKRDEARKGESAELTQEYDKLIEDQKNKLLSVAEGMTTLTKKGLHEHKGPCPMCGGHDRFSVNTRGVPFWFCRGGKNRAGCNEGGDTVALVAKKNGLTMWEAVEELAGYSPRDRAEVSRQRTYTKVTPDAPKQQPLTDFAGKFNACRQLFQENSLTAMAYFEHKRGLSRETVLKNRVGMAQTHRGLAIAYPCERFNDDAEWQVTAYNRRYLDFKRVEAMIEKAKAEAETEEEAKKAAKRIRRDNPKTQIVKSGKWGVYRLRKLKGARALMVVEGEENALSVWQATRANDWLADVVSVGSQSNFKSLQNDIMALCGDYQHLIIWADERKIADKALDLYRHDSALAIYSPQLANEDKSLDANDLLKRGELDEVLRRHLGRLSASLIGVHDDLLDAGVGPAQDTPQTDASPQPAKAPQAPERIDETTTMTASDELLYLCVLLAEDAQDKERGVTMYLEAERRYMYEDVTSLFEQYQEMARLLTYQLDLGVLDGKTKQV